MLTSTWDWQILWDAAIADIPELHRQVLNILTAEFSESGTN
jgi:hypothetical protein